MNITERGDLDGKKLHDSCDGESLWFTVDIKKVSRMTKAERQERKREGTSTGKMGHSRK